MNQLINNNKLENLTNYNHDIIIITNDHVNTEYDINIIKKIMSSYEINIIKKINQFNEKNFNSKIILILYESDEELKKIIKNKSKGIIFDNYDKINKKWMDIYDVISEIKKIYSKYINKTNIVILAQDYPGYGGFGTYPYNLYKKMRQYNCKIIYFYQEDYSDKIKKMNDPNILSLYLPNLYKLLHLNKYEANNQQNINTILKFLKDNGLQECKILISISPVTLIISELCFKYYKHFYRTGFLFIEDNKVTRNEDLWEMTDQVYDRLLCRKYSLDFCYKNKYIEILPNSPLVELFEKEMIIKKNNYVNNIHKYYIGLNYDLKKKNIKNKEYDLIFVASRLNRSLKNFQLIELIFQNNPNLKKVLIGKGSLEHNNAFKNTLCFDHMSNEETQDYISKSKILLLPSLIDAGPSVFIESILSQCIPLSAKNTGFFQILKNIQGNYKFAMDSYEVSEWEESINFIISNYEYIYSAYDDIFESVFCEMNESCSRYYQNIILPTINFNIERSIDTSILIVDKRKSIKEFNIANLKFETIGNIIIIKDIDYEHIKKKNFLKYIIVIDYEIYNILENDIRTGYIFKNSVTDFINAKNFLNQQIMYLYSNNKYLNKKLFYVIEKNELIENSNCYKNLLLGSEEQTFIKNKNIYYSSVSEKYYPKNFI